MNGASVVIPTAGGRADILRRSLQIVLEDGATEEVVVVADRPDAATAAVLREIAAREARLRVVPAAAGAGGLDRGQANRETGALAASGELIVALDDDVEPSPGLISAHATRHSATDRLVLLGYMPVAPVAARRGGVRATARLYAEAYERECRLFESSPDQILLRLWAGNMSARRDAWLRAAPARGHGAYHVDREFGLRLHAIGMEGAFDRSLRAVHHYRRTAMQFLDDAVSSGIGRAGLHMSHPELERHEPVPAPPTGPRSLLWRGRSRRRLRIAGLALAAGADAAAAVRLTRLEHQLVKAIWALGYGRGLYESAGGGG